MKRITQLLGVLFVLAVLAAGTLWWMGRERLEEPEQVSRGHGLEDRDTSDQIVLFFGARDQVGLVPETRTVISGLTLEDRLRACIRELAEGSLSGSLPVVPPDTRLKRAYLDSWGVIYLDFSRELLGRTLPGDGEEWLAVASVVHSVCDNYPEVREVRFLVEGQMVVSLGGYMDLEEPLRATDFPLRRR